MRVTITRVVVIGTSCAGKTGFARLLADALSCPHVELDEVGAVLLEAGSEPSQRNKHGLTPLGCAVGGTQGRWKQFPHATAEEWERAAKIIRSYGGVE